MQNGDMKYDDIRKKVIPIAIEDEMRESYLNYAMSVIVSRALPDVRDGLKPVHRRILYSMHQMGLRSDRAYKKCGRIVGDVLGKYHPHGDAAIYDSLVRLAQDFSLRYPVVKPQGNFGSVDGDPPAAMRYTEAKMHAAAEEMLRDINKETIDYGANYDESLKEPLVLPAAFPFLLLNGGSGIAVGMATNIPPHNINEVTQAITAYISNPDITLDELTAYIKGPDFPTGGIIYGISEIRRAYLTGRGRITVRARCSMEENKKGSDVIIVTELPYQVNKANLISRIADHVRNKRIEGIADLRDESDRNGMRIVIELKKSAVPRVVLNQLYAHTALQQNFNVNSLALVNGRPKLLSLKEMIYHYVNHRKDVIIRRTKFDLRKAEERAHLLEGLEIALQNIDEVVEIIKSSDDVGIAKNRLMARFTLSEVQAQAILDMRLQKLTSLETQKIVDELGELKGKIEYYKELLSSESKILQVAADELRETNEKFKDERRTEIRADEVEQLDVEDLITEEDMVVLVSNRGFVKRVPLTAYRRQGRGGRGSSSAKLRDEDFINHLFVASTHDYIMFVTSIGKAYWLKVHEIPEGSRQSKGSHIKALMNISPEEEINAIVSIKEFTDDEFLFMVTSRGVVKKAAVSQFVNAKKRGIIAIKLDDDDKLVSAQLTGGNNEALLVSRNGYALRFPERSVRAMGRATRGVRGMNLSPADEIAAIMMVDTKRKILIITEGGYGKRLEFDSFSVHSRATKGQIAYKIQEKTGRIAGALSVSEIDNLMSITSMGTTLRIDVSQIPVQGRTASGVIVSNIQEDDRIVAIARVDKEEDAEEEALKQENEADESAESKIIDSEEAESSRENIDAAGAHEDHPESGSSEARKNNQNRETDPEDSDFTDLEDIEHDSGDFASDDEDK